MVNNSVRGYMAAAERNESYVTETFGFRPTTLLMMYSAIAVLGLLGLMGNVVSMVIWTRPQVKSSSSVLLTVLAVCDCLIVISANTLAYSYILWLNYYDSPAIIYMDQYIFPFVMVWFRRVYFIAETASIYLTLTITLERYISVCHPFQARLVCTYSNSCKYAATVITVSILFNSVEFLNDIVGASVNDEGGITYYGYDDTDLSQSHLLQSMYKLYDTWLRLIFIYLLPLMFIALLNTLIYLEMKRAEKWKQTLTVSQRKQNRMTLMLVYVVAEFLVCLSVDLLCITAKTLDLFNEQLARLTPLKVFFETFNSSSNILTYALCWRGFREALISTFSCYRGLRPLRSPNRTDG